MSRAARRAYVLAMTMTLTSAQSAVLDGSSALQAARALAPTIRDRALEAERLGTLPDDIVDALRDAGLFRIAQPRALGGFELDPTSSMAVIEELSAADASAGWTFMIGVGAAAFAAWLDPAVARNLFGSDAGGPAASVFAPTGRATPLGSGQFRVDGRWPFASGCRHARWFLNGVLVTDGERPRQVKEHTPDWRLAFLRRSDVAVLDSWDVAGLRATGSNDVEAHEVLIGEELTIQPFSKPACHQGPLWRLPFFTLIGVLFAGFPLGVGRRALDEFAQLATSRGRGGNDAEPIAEDGAAQLAFSRAEAGLQAARAFVLDAIEVVWRSACAGDVPGVHDRARLQLSVQHAMRAALDAVEVAFTFAGASAARTSHPLQRCLRDLRTANQHIYFSSAALKRYAQLTFGLADPGPWV
jgi:indole-3-acetate monooxygenase